MAESGGRQPIAARCAAYAQIDPAWEEGVEDPELLGDLQGRVVAEHDPAAPHPDPLGAARDLADQNFRTRASERRGVVVLRHPVAGVSQSFGMTRKLDRLFERLRRRSALPYRGLIDHGQSDVI